LPREPDVPAEDRSSPADWVDQHGDALYRFALLRVRDASLAEELVQECFLAALDARERFSGRSSERTWLIGILKRKIIDHLRSSSRRRQAEEEQPEDIGLDLFSRGGKWKSNPARWGGDPGSLAGQSEFWAVLRSCLEKLPSSLASAFLLRELDHMQTQDICEVLGLTPTNLWARLHRARTLLRACLDKRWFGR